MEQEREVNTTGLPLGTGARSNKPNHDPDTKPSRTKLKTTN